MSDEKVTNDDDLLNAPFGETLLDGESSWASTSEPEEFVGDLVDGEAVASRERDGLDEIIDPETDEESEAAARRREADQRETQRLKDQDRQLRAAAWARQADADFEQLINLSPEQRQQYLFEQARRRQAMEDFQVADRSAKADFAKSLKERQFPARYADEVEAMLQECRQSNLYLNREVLLERIVGREAIKRRASGAPVRERGQQSQARGRTRQDAEDERLLKGITVGDFDRASRG